MKVLGAMMLAALGVARPMEVASATASPSAATSAASVAPKSECPDYPEGGDADARLGKALAEAKSRGKRVLVFLGDNSCPWCVSLCEEMKLPSIRGVLDAGFVSVKISVEGENQKRVPWARLGIEVPPAIPYFVVLDSKGTVLVQQRTEPFETKGYGHDEHKLIEFLSRWSPPLPKRGPENPGRPRG
jgi:hypothetical protein